RRHAGAGAEAVADARQPHAATAEARRTHRRNTAMTVFDRALLKGRAALITGGGTGICRGTALPFAEHGCDVAITSRTSETLEPAAKELRDRGVRAVATAADVRDPAAIDAAVAACVDELGRLDILINGAAGNFICLAEHLSPNGFGAVVDIDLKGTFNV